MTNRINNSDRPKRVLCYGILACVFLILIALAFGVFDLGGLN